MPTQKKKNGLAGFDIWAQFPGTVPSVPQQAGASSSGSVNPWCNQLKCTEEICFFQ
jgi:hypothetical protein